MKRIFIFILLSYSLTIYSQHKVSGVIKDQTGETIPSVSIKVTGTNIGTIADFDGNYTIEVEPNAKIEFSFIGFKTQIVDVNSRNVINVELNEEVRDLDEVVVTAVGIKQQKKKLGYTTQQVDANVIEQANPINLASALSGQVAGLVITNPTGIFQTPEILLRGQKPLIVVDGIPVESDMFDLSSFDIESINVLKGTSASALYGSRGKNGAILIITKKAETEGLELNVNLSSMVSVGFTVFPETQNQYGSGSEGKYEFWDGADGGISDGDMTWGPKFTPGLLVKQWNSPIRNRETGETIPWWGDVEGSIYNDRSLYERVPTPFERHDNLNDFLQMGMISQANFSLANKSQRSNTFFSGNYAHQKGQVPNTSITTGGLNFANIYNISDKLTLSSNLMYSKVYSPNYPRYGYGPKNHMYTIMLWMSDDVDINDLKKHMYRPDSDGYRQANYNYAWYNNPYFMAYELTQKHDRDVLSGQLKLTYDVLPNLTLQGRASARNESKFEDIKVPKSYMNYEDSRNGDYKNWNRRLLNFDSDFLASYYQNITPDILFTINAGASVFYRSLSEQYQTTDGLIVPNVYNMANSEGPVLASNSLYEKGIYSLYSSVNLDLYESVFLTFTGRNDWASTLPESNNSYFYPSVSLSTMVSEYIKMPQAIDFLKLYTSWAVVSNDLSPYSLRSAYNEGEMYGSMPSVTYPSDLVNPNIEPEKTTSYEVGLAASFAKSRLSAEFTYYHNIDENQIIQLPISQASGWISQLVNGNVYKTNGYEVVVGFKPIITKDFSWNVAANFTSRIRKLTEIYNNADKYGNLQKGDRADAMYATVWMKSASGDLILDSRGMPTHDSYVQKIGNVDPDAVFGLQNVFKIKKFTVNVDLDGAIGGTLVSNTHQKMWWAGKHPKSTTWRDAEYEAGKPVYVPDGVVITSGELVRDMDGNVLSDTRTYEKNTTAVSWQTWAQNYPYRAVVTVDESKEFANTFERSFLKLRRISISYDIKPLLGNTKIKALDVSLFGHNLFVLKKTPYLDPDFGPRDNDLQDPSSRYIGVSVNLKY